MSRAYKLRNRVVVGHEMRDSISVSNGKLVSLNIEEPSQKEVPLPVSPSMPALIPASSIKNNIVASSKPCFDDVCEPRTIFSRANSNSNSNSTSTSNSNTKDILYALPLPPSRSSSSIVDVDVDVAAAAHNDEQTMIWHNISKLFMKCENNESCIHELQNSETRVNYDDLHMHIYNLQSFTDKMFGELQIYKTIFETELAETKKTMKKRIRSTKKFVNRKLDRASVSKNDHDDLQSQLDELREKVESQNAIIQELRHIKKMDITDLQHKMFALREEVDDLKRVYDDDYEVFFKREEDMKNQITAAHEEALNAHKFALSAKQNSDERIDSGIKAIETWGSDIYRIEQEMKNLNKELRDEMDTDHQATEYWIERELRTFAIEKADIKTNIDQVKTYIDTVVVGNLREEFARAISNEVAFESKVSAQLVQSVHDELTALSQGKHNEVVDLITRSNEIHTTRYFHALAEMEKNKEDSLSMCRALKDSIGLVDTELVDVKDSLYEVKGDMARLTVEVDDQTESIKRDIYSDMDADYYDLKKYIYNKLKKHMKDEHHHDSSVHVEKTTANVIESAAVVDAADAAVVEEFAEHLGNSVSAVMTTTTTNADDEVKNDNKEDDGIIIMLDDASYHSSDNE